MDFNPAINSSFGSLLVFRAVLGNPTKIASSNKNASNFSLWMFLRLHIIIHSKKNQNIKKDIARTQPIASNNRSETFP